MAERNPVQLVVEEQSRLAREFHDIPLSLWAAPSRCEGWNNAVVVGHMVFHARVYRDSVARALNGDSTPPRGSDGQPLTRESFLSLADSGQKTLAHQTPSDLVSDFSRAGDELADMFKRLAPTDLDVPAWHYTSTLTIGILVAYHLYELAFHGWDVRSAIDPAAQIRAELCPFLVGTVRQLLPWLCAPDSTLQATCRFEVDGQIWTSQIRGGKLEEVADSAGSDATIRTDACTFLLLATTRQTLDDCAKQITIDGARDQAEQMLRVGCFRI